MKYSQIFFIIAVIFLPVTQLSGQEVPYGINYQAVARDNYGDELTNKQIDIRFSALSGTPLGNLEYQEVHTGIVTSRYGVFSVIIGQGTPVAGDCECFSDIAWETDPHFLKVEIRFGSDFSDMGTMQFLSVPYALYAARSLEPGPEGPEGVQGPPGDPASDDQVLSFEGENLTISGGNTVNLSVLANDPNDEIQYLSIAGDSLSITGGNSIKLEEINIDDADADPENEIQDLRLINDILKITPNPIASEIDLAKYLDDKDEQVLSFEDSDSTLTISGGNIINLASVLRDDDVSDTNEIQDILLDGNNKLSITNNTTSAGVELSPFLDNTDEQELGFNSGTKKLYISNVSDSVSLSTLVNDADFDPVNELITGVSIEGTELVIDEGSNQHRVDLSGNIVAFRVKKETSVAAPIASDVTFIPDYIEYNEGSAFDELTGEFTAPFKGIYTFNATFTADGSGGSRRLSIYLYSSLLYDGLYEDLEIEISPSAVITNRSITMRLLQADVVKLVVNTGLSTQTGTGTFSGFRVY
ncbi:MAG: complement C1q domain-containing protein [Bacteroidales bacterium]|nr:complement C1q domain-containing protein [Bacteroidales bacterium]